MKSVDKIAKITVYSFSFLIPLFFLPIFTSQFDLSKLILASVTFAILFICFGIKVVNNERTEVKYSFIDLLLFLFTLSYFLIALFVTPNKMEAFFVPGDVSILVLSFLIYFFGKQFVEVKSQYLGFSILSSSIVVSLVSLLVYVGIADYIPALKTIISKETFSTLGSRLSEVLYLVAVLPIGISYLVKEKDKLTKTFFILAEMFVVIAITINILSIKTKNNDLFSLNNLSTSWQVMTETIKKNPLFGIGPSNYQSAFSMYLPISYNNQENWNIRFSNASTYLMNIGTETGLIGLVLFSSIIFFILKERKLSTSILAIASLLFPFGSTLIFSFFLLILFEGNGRQKEFNLAKVNRYLILAKLTVVLSLMGYLSFFGFKYVKAEALYKKAVDALILGNGKKSYDLLKLIIEQSPNVDRYHLTYSRVNFAIATSLSKKSALTDEDKSAIASLIVQSTREAKTAVTLNPQRSSHWENLAKIYQSIAPFTDGAGEFAIQSYNQAISLDPINPNLRIALGGLYYALGDFDKAIKTFELAVLAKPDLANAHYNLSAALREKGELEKAIDEMQKVVELTQNNQNDNKAATSELEKLKNKKVTNDFEESDNLTPPEHPQE